MRWNPVGVLEGVSDFSAVCQVRERLFAVHLERCELGSIQPSPD